MKNILMPRLGLTMEEGLITKWHVAEGDSFQEGQVIFEVETDKVTTDVEATFTGRITKILVPENETAAVSTVIAEAE